MKLITHYIFSIGLSAFVINRFLHGPLAPSTAGFIGFGLSFIVNLLIDTLGHRRKFVDTPQGYRKVPARTRLTHSIFTAPIWGAFIGWGLLGVILNEAQPAVIWAAEIGVIIAAGHLLLDSFTMAGVYSLRKRIAIAHWQYNSFLGNGLFIAIGIMLIWLSRGAI
jgi:hypothetical protein